MPVLPTLAVGKVVSSGCVEGLTDIVASRAPIAMNVVNILLLVLLLDIGGTIVTDVIGEGLGVGVVGG